jgi:hypothetical protein
MSNMAQVTFLGPESRAQVAFLEPAVVSDLFDNAHCAGLPGPVERP